MAVAVSAITMFLLGAIWFSVLFSKSWVAELKHHNVLLKAPSHNKLMMSMGLTLLQNSVVAFAMACLVSMTGSSLFESGLTLGLVVACGFSASAIGGVFIWEDRSLKLFLIDSGYQVVGVVASAIILSLWR